MLRFWKATLALGFGQTCDWMALGFMDGESTCVIGWRFLLMDVLPPLVI